MSDYVTCKDCLKNGKPQQNPDYYSKNCVIATIECAYCGRNLNHEK